MSDEQLAELRRIEESASKCECTVVQRGSHYLGYDVEGPAEGNRGMYERVEDAEKFAAAWNNLHPLLDAIAERDRDILLLRNMVDELDGAVATAAQQMGFQLDKATYTELRGATTPALILDELAEKVAAEIERLRKDAELAEAVVAKARSVWLFSRGYVSEGVEIPDTPGDAVEHEDAARHAAMYRAIERLDAAMLPQGYPQDS